MLDPLNALSIAGCVVQFVDFGVKLVEQGSELYESGSIASNDELELITRDLTRLTEDILEASRHAPDHSASTALPPSAEELDLEKLAISCREIGEQLLALLGSLKVHKSGTALENGLESFTKAIQNIRKKKKIEQFEKRLKTVQGQLNIRILALFNDKQSQVQSLLDDLSAENRRTEANICNRIDKLQSEIRIAAKQADSNRVVRNKNAFRTIGTKCLDLAKEGERVAAVQKVLRSVNFESIKMRQDIIKEAHARTFEWVFEEGLQNGQKHPGFLKWLREGAGIYWVSGKAGSGKSTLMKLLCGHQSTRNALRQWVGNEQLAVASYFFWNAGNTMQKSRQGLLRSILYQILRECPEVIPIVCPSRWNVNVLDYESADPWTHQELLESFDRLAKQNSLSAKFCFFVDGLDEYEGEEIEIIKTLQDLVFSSNVKICAASRPWNAFEKAFGQNLDRKFVLQEFTKTDIRLYATNTLNHKGFSSKRSSDPQNQQLIEDIVERAQGVFLWVYLVVRSLLRGLIDDNDINLMRERLDSFPRDLEGYFKEMMNTIEGLYQEQTARIFQVVVHARSPLPAISFWFLGKEKIEPNYALDIDIENIPDEEVALISERMRTHLNACCKDFLEVNIDQSESIKFMQYRVDFLHRTVRDFLMTNDMSTLIESRTGPDFDARVALCRLSLAQVKILPSIPLSYPQNIRFCDKIRNLVCELISYALDIEIHNEVPEFEILNELEQTLSSYIDIQKDAGANVGVFSGFDSQEFLAAVTRAGLRLYVTFRLRQQPELLKRVQGKQSLLEVSLNTSSSANEIYSTFNSEFHVDVDMATLLLACGASPNSPTADGKRSIWQKWLETCYRERRSIRRGGSEDIYRMADILIRSRANLEVEILAGRSEVVVMEKNPLLETSALRAIRGARASLPDVERTRVEDKYIGLPEILREVFPPPQYKELTVLIAERCKDENSSIIWEWLEWLGWK